MPISERETTWLLKEKYQGVESEAFFADCAKLNAGVPLGYLIGHVPFLDCTIYLDSHPLIPRPETEYWTEQAINTIKSSSTRLNLVLDLCAGSGAIGVAVAKAIPEARITFIELDPAHLPTIEKNLIKNTILSGSEKCNLRCGDLFKALEIGERYHYILTNPPYIDAQANTVDTNVTENEPHLALFGGVAGMELISEIIVQAPKYLLPSGQLWIEHEPAQVEAITSIAKNNGYTIITHPDQYGVPRFSVLTMAQ